MDQPLTELGQRQAATLAAWLPQNLPRNQCALCQHDATGAPDGGVPLANAYHCDIHFDDRVREIGNNQIDHTAWPDAELPRKYTTRNGRRRARFRPR